MKAVDPVNADEFRKGLRIAQCMASYFEMMGLPMRRKYMDKLAEQFLIAVDAGEAPPFNGVQAAAAVQGFVEAIWDEMSDSEREGFIRAGDAFNSKIVQSAPAEAQRAFALKVAQEWAADL